MRVTNNMRQADVLRRLQANLAELAKAESEISTGKRFTRASEDPVAAGRVMRSDRSLRGIEQYRRNVTSVRARIDAEEGALGQLSDLLTRAKELAVLGSSASATTDARQGAATEVDRILEQVVQLGNTKVGSEYLFGGHQTTTAPFQADGTYLGDDGARQAEIAQDYVIQTNHTGRELLVNSGIVAGLTSLRDSLRSGTPAAVGQTMDAVDTGFDAVQVLLAETGARSRQIDSASENLDASESSLTVGRESDQGITLEEATTHLMSVQTTLQAALLATSRVMNLSLTEYLR